MAQPREMQVMDAPAIQTEIMDPNLPSTLDFEKPSVVRPNRQLKGSQILNYTMRGKPMFSMEQKYLVNSAIGQPKPKTITVKCYDTRSGIMDSIRGYCKRQLGVDEGFIYLYEVSGAVLVTREIYELSSVLKVFHDLDEKKVRIVFKGREKPIHKDFGVESPQHLIQIIADEALRIGLRLQE